MSTVHRIYPGPPGDLAALAGPGRRTVPDPHTEQPQPRSNRDPQEGRRRACRRQSRRQLQSLCCTLRQGFGAPPGLGERAETCPVRICHAVPKRHSVNMRSWIGRGGGLSAVFSSEIALRISQSAAGIASAIGCLRGATECQSSAIGTTVSPVNSASRAHFRSSTTATTTQRLGECSSRRPRGSAGGESQRTF